MFGRLFLNKSVLTNFCKINSRGPFSGRFIKGLCEAKGTSLEYSSKKKLCVALSFGPQMGKHLNMRIMEFAHNMYSSMQIPASVWDIAGEQIANSGNIQGCMYPKTSLAQTHLGSTCHAHVEASCLEDHPAEYLLVGKSFQRLIPTFLMAQLLLCPDYLSTFTQKMAQLCR